MVNFDDSLIQDEALFITPVDCLLFDSFIRIKALPSRLLGSDFDFCIKEFYLKKKGNGERKKQENK